MRNDIKINLQALSTSFYQARRDEFRKTLSSDSPEAIKVRRFFEKYEPNEESLPFLKILTDEVTELNAPFELLILQFVSYQPSIQWEKLETKHRSRHAKKVANHARALAGLLEEDPHPIYPGALSFFDDRYATMLLSLLPENLTSEFVTFQLNGAESIGATTAEDFNSVFSFYGQQQLSPVLRRLAEFSEKTALIKRDARPNTGEVDARIFTRSIADFFKLFYSCAPNEVIASCVCIRFPELDNPPDAETIRSWRGSR